MTICRTVEEVRHAARSEPCGHGVAEINDCPACRLTDAEAVRMAALLRPYLKPAADAA